jgi:hypothetical protein
MEVYPTIKMILTFNMWIYEYLCIKKIMGASPRKWISCDEEIDISATNRVSPGFH